MENRQEKWDKRFLQMAELVAGWSLDPSTRTGAVIVDNDNRVVSVGYNGFPKGIEDTPERLNNRELKYSMIVHCEINAILFANRSLVGCTLYTWPFMSCSGCSKVVVQSGIKRCVAPKLPESLAERWGKETELSAKMFQEAGIELVLL